MLAFSLVCVFLATFLVMPTLPGASSQTLAVASFLVVVAPASTLAQQLAPYVLLCSAVRSFLRLGLLVAGNLHRPPEGYAGHELVKGTSRRA